MPNRLAGLIKAAAPQRAKNAIKSQLGVPSVEASLHNLWRNGFRPGVVLDIGAYHGDWTVLCKAIWPDASVLMIEASPERVPRLKKVAGDLEDVTVVEALLGPRESRSVAFYEQDSASSVLPESGKTLQPFQALAMRTLEDVTRGTAFAKPDFIKLDVQGYELAVLQGGRPNLRASEVVLVEVNLMEIYQGAPLLNEVVRFMAEEGMQAYDICTLYRRPLDNALWQIDMIFVRDDSPLRASQRWE